MIGQINSLFTATDYKKENGTIINCNLTDGKNFTYTDGLIHTSQNHTSTVDYIDDMVNHIKLLDENFLFYLLAYNKDDDSYIGGYDSKNNRFIITASISRMTEVYLNNIKQENPNYKYRIVIYGQEFYIDHSNVLFENVNIIEYTNPYLSKSAIEDQYLKKDEFNENEIEDIKAQLAYASNQPTNLITQDSITIFENSQIIPTAAEGYTKSGTCKLFYFKINPTATYYIHLRDISCFSNRFGIYYYKDEPEMRNSYCDHFTYTYSKGPTTKIIEYPSNCDWMLIKYYDLGLDGENIITPYDFYITTDPTISEFIDEDITSKKIHISENILDNNLKNKINKISYEDSRNNTYGICIDNNDRGIVTRTNAAIGLNNNYCIDDIMVFGTLVNDFDYIYPWNEIKLCNLNYDNDGNKIITYENENGFSRDGSNGNVMVEIPVFFERRYVENNKEYIEISGTHKAGFIRDPAFYDSITGEPINFIYIGAYKTNINNDDLNSFSGVRARDYKSFAWFASREHDILDFVSLEAVRKLMIIEFASITFPMFGGLSDLPWASSIVAHETATGINRVKCRGDYRIDNLWEGMLLRVGTAASQDEPRILTKIEDKFTEGNYNCRYLTFNGDPFDVEAMLPSDEICCFKGCGQKTGLTDNLIYHTGRCNLIQNSIFNQFKYRGIESLWGELGCYVGGVKVINLRAYITSYKEKYNQPVDDAWVKLSYALPEQNTYVWQNGMIIKMGLDRRYPSYMLPEIISADGSGSEDEFYGDLACVNYLVTPEGKAIAPGTEFVLINSMAYDGKKRNGLFMTRFWSGAGSINSGGSQLYGSRMCDRTK